MQVNAVLNLDLWVGQSWEAPCRVGLTSFKRFKSDKHGLRVSLHRLRRLGVKFSEQAADKTALSICLVLPASNAMRTRHLFCDQVF